MSRIQELAVRLAKKEGKKSSIKMGDAREIVSILSDMVYGENNKKRARNGLIYARGGTKPRAVISQIVIDLYLNGQRRYAKAVVDACENPKPRRKKR